MKHVNPNNQTHRITFTAPVNPEPEPHTYIYTQRPSVLLPVGPTPNQAIPPSFVKPIKSVTKSSSARRLKPLLFLAVLLLGVLTSKSASAGIIVAAPHYLGLNNGLVGYWTFDGPDISGTRAKDSSGLGNHGTITGAVPTAGKVGQALTFSNSGNNVTIPHAASINDLGPLTISAWIKPQTEVGNVISKDNNKWSFQLTNTNTIKFYVCYGACDSVAQRIATNNAIQIGVWQHVLVTWDGSGSGSNIHLYLNGKELSYQFAENPCCGDTRDSDAATDLIFAQSNLSGGTLDDVRIYNRALSANEISRLYRIGLGSTQNRSISADGGDALSKGLVGYWTFDGPDTHGTDPLILDDKSGFGNRGSSSNQRIPTKVAGKIGQALSFDGGNASSTGDYVNLGKGSSLDFQTRDMSISVLLMRQNGSTYILSDADSVDSYEQIFLTLGSLGNILFQVQNAGNYKFDQTPDNLITLGNWYHIVVTRTGSTLNDGDVKIYINGVSQTITPGTIGSPTMPAFSNVGNLTIGRNGDESAGYYQGYVDELRLYNRALSAGEVARLYNQTQSKFNSSKTNVLTNGLVGHWTFDGPDISGTRAKDSSGLGNHGTLTGANGLPTAVAGKIGQALNFDFVDDFINAGSGSSLDNLGPLTFSMWIYPINQVNYLINKHDDATSGDLAFTNDSNGFNFSECFQVSCTGGTLYRSTTIGPTFFQWQYVVVTWDGSANASNVHIYKNGVDISGATSDATGTPTDDSGGNLIIGSSRGTSNFFGGKMDDVRVYNRMLSAGEVNKLYQMGR